MILINPSLDCKSEKIITDKNGRFIIQQLSLDEQAIVLVNIYAPNNANQQVAFFSKLTLLVPRADVIGLSVHSYKCQGQLNRPQYVMSNLIGC